MDELLRPAGVNGERILVDFEACGVVHNGDAPGGEDLDDVRLGVEGGLVGEVAGFDEPHVEGAACWGVLVVSCRDAG